MSIVSVDFQDVLDYLFDMGVRIIVDGYNFIGQENGMAGNIERERDRLVDRLADYQKRKGFPITVVFDGWKSGWSSEHGEFRNGIEVVFSRHGEKADEVLIRMSRELGSAGIFVTSDRAVAEQVCLSNAVAISILEFKDRLSAARHEGGRQEEEYFSGGPVKKKGNPRRLSKKDRKKRVRLNKL